MSTKAFNKKTLFGTTIIAGFAALTVAGTAAAQTAPTAPARNGVCEPTVANDPDCGPVVNNPTGTPQTPAGSTNAEPATQGGNLPSSTDTSEEEPGVNTPDGNAGEVEAVVVTGSRIRRTDFTSATPVQVITSEQATLEGLVDTAEILQQSTVASGSFQTNDQLTGFLTQGGGGVNTVSLRGLGSERTLVILNGRRLGPAGVRGQVQAVDLGTIPQSLVARQEILTSGASSIYGSDAIAGVINLITRDNIDGVELLVSATLPLDEGGETYRASATFGKRFDARNAFFNVSFDYFENKPLLRSQREDTDCAEDYLFRAQSDGTGSAGGRLDYTNAFTGEFQCYGLLANVISNTNGTFRYAPTGVPIPNAQNGNNSPYPGLVRQARPGFPDTYPYANTQDPLYGRASVISPAKRYTIAGTGGFDLTENLEVYTELLVNRRESVQLGVRQLFPTPTLLAANNPNNLQPNGTSFGIANQFVIALPIDREQSITYARGVLGIRGDLPDVGMVTGLNFDLYGQFSRSDGDYTDDSIYNDRFQALLQPLVACAQPTAANNLSNFNCSSLPNGIPWTSQRVLSGQFNDAERAFLFVRDSGNTIYDHMYLEGVLSASSLFTLPAGPVGAAVGFQLRKEEIDDTPGPLALKNNVFGSTVAGPTRGSDTIRELFGEVEIPLLRGVPFFENLSINASGRYSDYKSYGESKTYKVSANWQVVDFLRLRASQGTSFRAPALFELFLGNQSGFLGQATIDPCINYQNSTDPLIPKNCAAIGIPEGYTGAGTSSATILTGGGLGVLVPETSKQEGLGFVLTPKFADVSLAVDYFEIAVDDEVRTFGAGNIVRQCMASADFPNNPFCTLFTRGTQGTVPYAILTVNNSYVNVANQKNRGIDVAIRYRRELGFADLTIDGRGTWQLQDTVNLLGGLEEDQNGTTYGNDGPDFTGELNARLDVNDYTFSWAMNFIGKGSDTELFGGDVFNSTRYTDQCRVGPVGTPTVRCSSITSPTGALPAGTVVVGQPTYFKQYAEFMAYHTFSVRRRYNDFTFLAGIANAFDERPPAQSSGQFRVGTAALNGYDLRGRRLFFNIGKTF